MRTPWPRQRWAIAWLVGGLALVGACTGGDGDEATSGDIGSDSVDEAAGSGSGGATGDDADARASFASFDGEPIQPGRSIIATARIAIEVDDVGDAASDAQRAATRAGGFVADQDADLASGRISITLRVPASAFEEVLDAVAALGAVQTETIDTDDVTEEIVDLESRIGSARASVERVRELLGRSGDVSQLAAVEGELARREADLESLLGRKRVLEDQVDLSTIEVALAGTSDVTIAAEADDEDRTGFLGGLRTGWDSLVAATAVVLTVVGFVTPFVPVVALGLALWLWRRRRSGLQVGEPDHARAGA